MKTCCTCRTEKSEELFAKNSALKGGLDPRCKACKSAASKSYRMRPEVKSRAVQATRDWRARNPAHANALAAAWRAKNPDRFKAIKKKCRQTLAGRNKERAWVEANRGLCVSYSRKWALNHPLEARAYDSKKRAKRAGAQLHQFMASELELRMSVFGFACAYCGGPFQDVDHVKPLSRGGPHCLSNLRPSCEPCNSRKHAKDHKSWFASLRKQ